MMSTYRDVDGLWHRQFAIRRDARGRFATGGGTGTAATAKASRVEPSPPPSGEPWQQTKADHMKPSLDTMAKMKKNAGIKEIDGEDIILGNIAADHAHSVYGAAKAGKKIPDAVLKDYPMLKASMSGPKKEPWETTKNEWAKGWAEKNAIDPDMLKALSGSMNIASSGKHRVPTPGERRYLEGRKLFVSYEDKVNNESGDRKLMKHGPELEELYSHRKAVFQAMKAGKTVPSNVLNGYPDLAKAAKAGG